MRWNNINGRKEVRFASWCKNSRTRKCEWRMRGLAKPRPLFNLNRLFDNPDKPVIVFEGCRKADRAAKLFPDHICTAFANGANAVGHSDLKPLHGRKVLIWRDADEPGEAFAYSIGYALKDYCSEIQEVDFEAVYRVCAEDAEQPVPEGWDVVDALASKADHGLIARTALNATRALDLNVERPDGRSFIKVGNATLTPSGGLIMQVLKGKGDNAVLEDVWVSGAFEVLGLSRDATGSDWGVFIAWRDNDGNEHSECVQRSEMFGDQKKLATRLVAEGFPLAFGRERMFAQFLTMVRPRTRVTEVSSTGWHDIANDKVFVLPEETFGSVRGETVRLKADLTNSCYARSGTIEDWRDTVGVLAQDQTLLMFAISAALAGVLLKLTGTDGGGFHLYGPSSKGKTTALRLAASVWGPGSTQGFHPFMARHREWT